MKNFHNLGSLSLNDHSLVKSQMMNSVKADFSILKLIAKTLMSTSSVQISPVSLNSPTEQRKKLKKQKQK
jgi:hypothetical protein